jgi:hypothetical protein
MVIGVTMAIHFVNCARLVIHTCSEASKGFVKSWQQSKLGSVLREWRLYVSYSRHSP